MEAAAPSMQTVQLAAVVLELLRAPALDTHPQPFVRRAALVAASQVRDFHCRIAEFLSAKREPPLVGMVLV